MSRRPCVAECPKCGSIEANRQFMVKGQLLTGTCWSPSTPSTEYACLENDDAYRITKDCINHACKCCKHIWQGPTLDAASEES